MLESCFKTELIKEIRKRLPGCIVCHLDPTETQGLPDILVLHNDKWAALEGKRNATASHRPNQDYYVEMMNRMSYAAFIYPENKEDILRDLQSALEPHRPARLSRGK